MKAKLKELKNVEEIGSLCSQTSRVTQGNCQGRTTGQDPTIPGYSPVPPVDHEVVVPETQVSSPA